MFVYSLLKDAWGLSSFRYSVKFSSAPQSCPTLCDTMDCSTPGFPVHHQLLELAQTHIHRVSDAIQPSHPLLSPSPTAFNLWSFPMSQPFESGGQGIGASVSASVPPMNIQDWFPTGLTGLISLKSKGLSRVFQHHSSKASIVWHSAFFTVQLSHPYMSTVIQYMHAENL